MPACLHEELVYEPSSLARDLGYVLYSWKDLNAAAGVTCSGNATSSRNASPLSYRSKYPAPLVLPEDLLSDPEENDPQSLDDWQELLDTDFSDARRRKIYLVPPPQFGEEALFMEKWTCPSIAKKKAQNHGIHKPSAGDICDYLKAFYDGLQVEMLPASTLTWDLWEGSPEHVALRTASEAIQITARKCRDGLLPKQLHLDPLLDVAISILPKDAAALVMLVDHDLYEDEDDDFVCGRAYGGNQVCVISTARYHPLLDQAQEVNRTHSWPASHCKAFMERYCEQQVEGYTASETKRKKPTGVVASIQKNATPLRAAVTAFKCLKTSAPTFLSSLWLWRVCRTASHEAGHCLGIDHCVYYACIMQGTARIPEDARQPPYLCPVDDAKLSALINKRGTAGDRDRSMLSFCRDQGAGSAFEPYKAWLETKMIMEGVLLAGI